MTMTATVDTKSFRTTPSRGSNRRFRIAIIGCGPKGMYCLDSLVRKIRDHQPGMRCDITLFECSRHPGAGPVYSPDQPHYLRMNFASRHIDAWSPDQQDARHATPSLCQWLEQWRPEYADPDGYAPRGVIGEYLTACFDQILTDATHIANVELVPAKVRRVVRNKSRWQVMSDSGGTECFDEVLITVGHEGWRSPCLEPGLDDANSKPSFEISRVFPVNQQLSSDRVEAGSVVAVRGFALTWIDAALALTEGRGGCFNERNGVWTYSRSGNEPAAILPFSRTGRPMQAKPDFRNLELPRGIDDVWTRATVQLEALSGSGQGLNFQHQIWPIILESADRALFYVSRDKLTNRSFGRSHAWFEKWTTSECSPTDALDRMVHSYNTAIGVEPLDEGWALAESWRRLYPALVSLISFGGLASSSWREFRPIACEMERIAFGPPAENIGRILALVDARIIDLRCLRSRFITAGHRPSLMDQQQTVAVDAVIHAMIPSPQQFAPHSLLASLVNSGIARQMTGASGIEVNAAGRPITSTGAVHEGLSVIGRATEGCVLGNDTLSRRLHTHPEIWARSVAARLSSTAGAVK